jgi:hypothetical protein
VHGTGWRIPHFGQKANPLSIWKPQPEQSINQDLARGRDGAISLHACHHGQGLHKDEPIALDQQAAAYMGVERSLWIGWPSVIESGGFMAVVCVEAALQPSSKIPRRNASSTPRLGR